MMSVTQSVALSAGLSAGSDVMAAWHWSSARPGPEADTGERLEEDAAPGESADADLSEESSSKSVSADFQHCVLFHHLQTIFHGIFSWNVY
jgi:hypothetical protein